MEVRTVSCDVPGCESTFTEEKPNAGFPGWGHVQGFFNPETRSDIAHLCPVHLAQVGKILNGGDE